MMTLLNRIFLLDTDLYFLWWRLASPIYLMLLLVVPYLGWLYYKSGGVTGPLVYSDIRRITRALGIADGSLHRLPARHGARRFLFWIRTLCIILVILALARPQAERITEEVITHGVDILLAIDISGSMTLVDQPFGGEAQTRLEVTKKVVEEFVAGRQHDRIGLVVYAGEAYTRSPLTVDYGMLTDFLEKTEYGDVTEEGTAVGVAIATGLSRLRHTEAKSKVMVLLTDGVNNRGEITPQVAADMAAALGIKIYSIGVGSHGPIFKRVPTLLGTQLQRVRGEELDEVTLRGVAEKTGGRYFRALDQEGLEQIFEEISTLEKSEIESRGHRRFRELFPYLLVPALLLFLLEILLANTRLRKLP